MTFSGLNRDLHLGDLGRSRMEEAGRYIIYLGKNLYGP